MSNYLQREALLTRAAEYCRVLAQEIGPRMACSPQERQAAEYLAERLESLGASEVALEAFPCLAWEVESCGLLADIAVDAAPAIYSGCTPEEGVEADILFFDSGSDVDWSSPALRGKALVIYNHSHEDEIRADASGCAFLITVCDRIYPLHVLSSGPFPNGLPVARIGYWDAVRLRKSGLRRLRLRSLTRTYPAESWNVTGLIRGAEPNADRLCLGGHYDTVLNTPGAGDNAAGVAAVLLAAELLLKEAPKGEVHLVLFGSEEVGLAGARAYARSRRNLWSKTRLMVYFDGMGDVIGRNKLRAMGHPDLLEWAASVARETGYPCDTDDRITPLDNAWLCVNGVPSVHPCRPPQIAWHSPHDDLSVIDDGVIVDAALYAAQLLRRAATSEHPPFTPGVPSNPARSVEESLSRPENRERTCT